RPEPLQTIGDIFFDRREFNPETCAEYSQDTKSNIESNGQTSVRNFPNGQHLEEDAEGNPKTFKRVLVRFAERTSMQGVPYIYASSVWYAKVGWSLLFLVGFGMMVAHLYLLFDEFYEYDTHSTVSLGFSTLTFPAVTICNVNPIKRSRMDLATRELRALVDAVQPSNIAGSMEEERNKKNPPQNNQMEPTADDKSDPNQPGSHQTNGNHLSSGTNQTNSRQNTAAYSKGASGLPASTTTIFSSITAAITNTTATGTVAGTNQRLSDGGSRATIHNRNMTTEITTTAASMVVPSDATTNLLRTTTFDTHILTAKTSIAQTAYQSFTSWKSSTEEASIRSVSTNLSTTDVQKSFETTVTLLNPLSTQETSRVTAPIVASPTSRTTKMKETSTVAHTSLTIDSQTENINTQSVSTSLASQSSTKTAPLEIGITTHRAINTTQSAASTTTVKVQPSTEATRQSRPNMPSISGGDSSDTSKTSNTQRAEIRSLTGPAATRRRRSVSELHEETVRRRYKRFIEGFSIEESNDRYKPQEETDGWAGNKSAIRAIEDEFLFLYSTMGREARQEMGHDIAEMLMECTFRGISCSAEQFHLVQTAQYGNCYTIENNRFISSVGGPDDGLTMYLFLQDEEYLHGITNSMGFKVHIHNIGEFPNPYSEGLSVSAGMETFIGLKKVNIERQKHPYGDCVENEDFENVYNLKYTQRTCQAFCLQKSIIETCDCFDAENDDIFKRLANAKMIDVKNTTMGYTPCRTTQESACLRSQVSQFQNGEFSCECPSPCEESLYNKALSSKAWPTTEYASILVEYLCSLVNETDCETYRQRSRSEIASSFLKMVIYYEDLNYENITEEVDYETFQFVSDVGGTIGLWIGLSMISFFEVIQFLYEMVHYVIYMKPKLAREKAQKQKRRQEKNDVIHALKYINTNGLLSMSTAAFKLMGSEPGSVSKATEGQRSMPTRHSKQETGDGSSGGSGTGGDLSSGNEGHHLLLSKGRADQKSEVPWVSHNSGLSNFGFEGDQLSGLKDLGLMSSPPSYLSAVDANWGKTRDLKV
ncbi:acid-sensing ion channel 1, partial [Plakobranchus ocellatus]